MTPNEMLIETLRFRAPVVVPLIGGAFAVLCTGWTPETRIVEADELNALLTDYIEWNQLGARVAPAERDLLKELGL